MNLMCRYSPFGECDTVGISSIIMAFLKKKKFHSVVARIMLLSRTALIVLVFVCLRL
jgi:hypothetical protein